MTVGEFEDGSIQQRIDEVEGNIFGREDQFNPANVPGLKNTRDITEEVVLDMAMVVDKDDSATLTRLARFAVSDRFFRSRLESKRG